MCKWVRAFPARFDAVTEGEDKPLKYPTIFNSVDEHSVGAARDAHLPSLSQDWGGMEEYLNFLPQQLAEQKTVAHG